MPRRHNLVEYGRQRVQGLVGLTIRQNHLGEQAALAQGGPQLVHIKRGNRVITDDNNLGTAHMPGEQLGI